MKITKLDDPKRKKQWKLDGAFGGRRVRQFFATEREAEAERSRLLEERGEAGPAGDRLTPAERIEFAALRDRLADHGASVREAVEFYLDHGVVAAAPVRMMDLLDEAIEAKSKEGKSGRYLTQLGSSVGQFCRWEGMGHRWAHEIATVDLERWVEGNGWAAKTRRNYLIELRTVFAFGKSMGALRINPTDGLRLPAVEDAEVVVLSPLEAARLVVRCLPSKRGRFVDEDFGSLLVYVTLGLFAGLRPERELGQLRLGAIHLEEAGVVIEGPTAKSRRRRVVDLSPNAVALLKVGIPLLEAHWESRRSRPGNRDDYRVCPPNFKRRWEELRRAVGFSLGKVPGENGLWWRGDIMRHSFASYHFAKHQNENLLKAQMGHTKGSEVLFQNYRLRVTRKEADRFWGIGS